MSLNPINASLNKYTPKSRPSFGQLTSVRYVLVDGQVVKNPQVVEDVAKTLVKTLKENKPEYQALRYLAKEAIPDFAPNLPIQSIQYLKSQKIDKNHNIITGVEAFSLKNIWKKGKVSLAQKKIQAGEIVKKLINSQSKHIAIDAVTQNVKGKLKYIIKNIYITI